MTTVIQRRGNLRPISALAPFPGGAGYSEVEGVDGHFYRGPASGASVLYPLTIFQLPLVADFDDDVGHGVTETGSVAIDPSTDPGSAVFSGAGGTIHIAQGTPINDMNIGGSPFAIEGWFKTTQAAQQDTCLAERDTGGFPSGAWAILINTDSAADGKVCFFSAAEDGANPVVKSGPGYNDGVRHHVRVVRHSSQYLLYLDGILVARTRYSAITNYADIVAEVKLGNSVFAPRQFIGHLDNWRMVLGSPVSSAFQFTVPTPPFPTG